MASKELAVAITAKDGASAVFKKIGDSTKSLGDAMAKAGLDADKFRDRFEMAARNVEDSNRQYEASNKVMRDVGISAGIVTAALGLASQSFREQQIALGTLDRSIGDAADQMRDFAQQIQDTTNYSNDAAVASENIAATLARNYGLTADEIQRVIQISADLAATSGLGLEDTTYRVVAAIRGEAEAAEALGLTMNQQAIDRDNLTLSMSNEEAAHFRLNALYQQSAFAQGAAAQQAERFYGTLTQGRDVLQDWSQTLGGSLGPFGDFGAFAADNAVQVGAMTVAVGQLVTTGSKLNTLATAMTGVNVASKAMALGLGPVGIAAAAGLAAVALYKLWDSAEGMVSPVEVADLALGNLEQTIRDLYAAGSTLGELGERATEGIFPDLTTDVARIEEIENAIAQTNRAMGGMDPNSEAYAQAQADLERWSFELMGLADQYGILDAQMLATTVTTADVAAGMDDLNAILQFQGKGAAQAQAETAELFDQWDRGEISAEELLKDLHTIATSFDEYNKNATTAAAKTAELTARMQQGVKVWEEYNKLAYGEGGQHLGQEHREAAEGIKQENAARDSAIAGMQDYLDLEQRIAGAAVATGSKIKDLNYDLDNRFTGAKEFGGEFKYDFNFGNALDGMTQAEKTMQDFGDRVIQAFDAIPTAAEAMDSVFQAIVGNTDSIGKSAQSIEDWATGFTDASEGMSRLDSILDTNNTLTSAATINQTEYNAAMEAFNTIGQENAEIQQDIAVIQAKQAPLIAEQVEQTENYLQSLADLPAAQQTVALGFMDAAQAGHALELQQLALDAALGNLGENGEAFATQIITGAVEADGQLKLMLEDMGLISVGADGTITVNFQDNASDGLSRLNDTVEKLAYTQLLIVADGDPTKADAMFQELFGHAAEWDDTLTTAEADLTIDHALAAFDEARNRLADWDRSSGTATVDADGSGSDATFATAEERFANWDGAVATAQIDVSDNASGTIGAVLARLHDLDGASATAYLNVVRVGDTGAFGAEFRHGGIPGYAHGGIPVELAEGNRAELLSFANGGVMPIFQHGIYEVPPHTYVSPSNTGTAYGGPNITVNFSGAVFNNTDAEAMDRWAQERLVPALRRVIQDERRGQAS